MLTYLLACSEVFEFQDIGDGLYRLVSKRVLSFGILPLTILACGVQYHAVPRSWFALWFATSQAE